MCACARACTRVRVRARVGIYSTVTCCCCGNQLARVHSVRLKLAEPTVVTGGPQSLLPNRFPIRLVQAGLGGGWTCTEWTAALCVCERLGAGVKGASAHGQGRRRKQDFGFLGGRVGGGSQDNKNPLPPYLHSFLPIEPPPPTPLPPCAPRILMVVALTCTVQYTRLPPHTFGAFKRASTVYARLPPHPIFGAGGVLWAVHSSDAAWDPRASGTGEGNPANM